MFTDSGKFINSLEKEHKLNKTSVFDVTTKKTIGRLIHKHSLADKNPEIVILDLCIDVNGVHHTYRNVDQIFTYVKDVITEDEEDIASPIVTVKSTYKYNLHVTVGMARSKLVSKNKKNLKVGENTYSAFSRDMCFIRVSQPTHVSNGKNDLYFVLPQNMNFSVKTLVIPYFGIVISGNEENTKAVQRVLSNNLTEEMIKASVSSTGLEYIKEDHESINIEVYNKDIAEESMIFFNCNGITGKTMIRFSKNEENYISIRIPGDEEIILPYDELDYPHFFKYETAINSIVFGLDIDIVRLSKNYRDITSGVRSLSDKTDKVILELQQDLSKCNARTEILTNANKKLREKMDDDTRELKLKNLTLREDLESLRREKEELKRKVDEATNDKATQREELKLKREKLVVGTWAIDNILKPFGGVSAVATVAVVAVSKLATSNPIAAMIGGGLLIAGGVGFILSKLFSSDQPNYA